jgi:hypothetical protein
MIPRSDRLKEPPIVGKWYMVPAILWNRSYWGGYEDVLHGLQTTLGAKWWPVWGIKHTDVKHFNFPTLHYHIDPRFLGKRHWAELRSESWHESALEKVQSSPINHTELPGGPPKPILRRMRCTMDHSEWQWAEQKTVASLNAEFAGKQCGSGKRGFVCPHKHFPLGSVKAVDGVVTCPLHGMRIDAETGKCLGPSINS